MESFGELLTLVENTNPQVKAQALAAVISYCKGDEYFDYICKNSLKTVQTLISSIFDKQPVISRLAVFTLLKFSSYDRLLTEMNKHKVVETIMKLLTSELKQFKKEEKSEIIEISLILLNNVTKKEDAARELLQENDETKKGFYVSKMMMLLFDPEYIEKQRWILNIFTNIARFEYGRSLIISAKIYDKLFKLLVDKNEAKRFSVINLINNLLHQENYYKEFIKTGVLDFLFSQIEKEPQNTILKAYLECIYNMSDEKEILGEKRYFCVLENMVKNVKDEEIKGLIESVMKKVRIEEEGQFIHLENVE